MLKCTYYWKMMYYFNVYKKGCIKGNNKNYNIYCNIQIIQIISAIQKNHKQQLYHKSINTISTTQFEFYGVFLFLITEHYLRRYLNYHLQSSWHIKTSQQHIQLRVRRGWMDTPRIVITAGTFRVTDSSEWVPPTLFTQ